MGLPGMSHKRGGSSIAEMFTAVLCITMCIGCVGCFDGDEILPFLKIHVRKMRNFFDAYHPEIGFAKCAFSNFPLYDLFPDTLQEFRPDFNEDLSSESFDLPSYRSLNSTTIPSPISTPLNNFSSLTAVPSASNFPLSLDNSTQYPSSSTTSPIETSQSLTSTSFPSSSIPFFNVSTPLPLLESLSPLQPNYSSLSSPPTTISDLSTSASSISIPTVSPPDSFISSTTSPNTFHLSSYILLQALSGSGISPEDSLFIFELLELFFPKTFNSSIAESLTASKRRDIPKVRENDSQNVADAWLEGLHAVLVSVFGAEPNEKRQPLWKLVPTLQWEPVVPSENHQLTQVSISRVAEEEEDVSFMSNWWSRVRNVISRWYNRLWTWMLPDLAKERLGNNEAKLVGLTHCGRNYLVDVIWRWGEEEAEELRREVRTKERQEHIFRPQESSVQVLPHLLKLLTPS